MNAKKPDRRRASTEVRRELRRQVLRLREQGKTQLELAPITGYRRPYVALLLKKLAAEPRMLEGMLPGGRMPGGLRALSAKDERRGDADLGQVPRVPLDAFCAVDARCDSRADTG